MCTLLEIIMWNSSVKLFNFGPVVLEMSFKDVSVSTDLATHTFDRANPFVQFL